MTKQRPNNFIAGVVVGLGLALLFILASCSPAPAEPTLDVPTHVDTPIPIATFHPQPTPYPTYTPFATYTPYPTIAPTDEPTPTSTFIPATPVPVYVKVLGSHFVLLRQVCFNLNGFVYNGAGFPVISDCIYPLKADADERIKYQPGDRIEVEPFGDVVFQSVHGFFTHNGQMTIRADGGEKYYVAVERGANGELLFVQTWMVKLLVP